MSNKGVEIFHLAADGSEHQVVLAVEFKDVTVDDGMEATVLSYLSALSSSLKVFDSLESFIDNHVEMAIRGGQNQPYVTRLGWDKEQICDCLGLPIESPVRCKELLQYLSVKYKMKLNF